MASSPGFANTVNKGTPVKITSANTSLEPTSSLSLVFTAPSTGSFVRKLIVRHLGTNVATVLRVFRNNGSSEAVAANNCLIAEKTIAANTLSQTAESIGYEVFLNLPLATTERLYCTIGTAVAAGVQVSVDAGDF
jgi:hypothetical protein